MFTFVTDEEKLKTAAEPLKLITEKGLNKAEPDEIITKLKAAFDESPDVLAISAPMIGIEKRLFGIRFNDGIKFFIDPIITKKSKPVISPETFASLPKKEILISRPEEITAVYYNSEYKYEDNKFLGKAARLFDQMCQTLDGILPQDLGLVSDPETDGSLADCSEEEIAELREYYKKYIAAKSAAYTKAATEDKETEKDFKQMKFTEKVINGDILVVSDDAGKPKFHEAEQKIIDKTTNEIVNKALKNAHDQELSYNRMRTDAFLRRHKGKTKNRRK